MIKIGEPLRYINEVRLDGALIDISAWVITAKARIGTDVGQLLGNYTVTHISLGIYQVQLDTAGFEPCTVCTDIKLVSNTGEVLITDTDKVQLLPAVTS